MAIASVFSQCTNGDFNTPNIITQFASNLHQDEHKFLIKGPTTIGAEVSPYAREYTKNIIEWLVKQPDIKNTVNMTGYSRGAIINIRIANYLKKIEICLERKQKLPDYLPKGLNFTLLQERLKNLSLHIFSIDPVAGIGTQNVINSKKIPNYVKSYMASIQIDEMRYDFKPQDMSRAYVLSSDTQVSWIPLYGNHSDGSWVRDKKLRSSNELMQRLLYQFLTLHGSKFSEDFSTIRDRSSNQELLALFQQMHDARNIFLTLSKNYSGKFFDGLPFPKKNRSIKKYMRFYVRQPSFFATQLERELFKITYPRIFNYFFENNRKDPRFENDSASLWNDLSPERTKLKTMHPDLKTRLDKYIRKNNLGTSIDDPNCTPGGLYRLEPCETLHQLFPDRAPKKQNRCQISQLAILETKIYRLCFQYERRKSDFVPFNEKNGIQLSRHIRHQVHALVNHKKVSEDEKIQQITKLLEKHYIQLKKARSNNEFSKALKRALQSQGYKISKSPNALPKVLCAKLINLLLTLLREAIVFMGTFGYLGCAIVSTIGTFTARIGKRAFDLIATHSLPIILVPFAFLFQYVGFALKHNFGLRPLTNLVASAIEEQKDNILTALDTVQVKITPNSPPRTSYPMAGP